MIVGKSQVAGDQIIMENKIIEPQLHTECLPFPALFVVIAKCKQRTEFSIGGAWVETWRVKLSDVSNNAEMISD